MSVSRKRKRRKEGGRGFFAKKGCQKLRKLDSGFGESAAASKEERVVATNPTAAGVTLDLRFGAKAAATLRSNHA